MVIVRHAVNTLRPLLKQRALTRMGIGAALALAVLAPAAPASAAARDCQRTPDATCAPTPPVARPLPPLPPLCVTTTWRAKHTHQPKTRVGEVCTFTWDMWLPRGYVILGGVPMSTGPDDYRVLFVQRVR